MAENIFAATYTSESPLLTLANGATKVRVGRMLPPEALSKPAQRLLPVIPAHSIALFAVMMFV
jgi:hypothetical protein